MTRGDKAFSISLILIAAIVIALSSPRLLSGLSLPPDPEDCALFEIVPPVLIIAGITLIALLRHRIAHLSPGRSWLLWVIVPSIAMSGSIGLYIPLSSKAIIRYRNQGDETQPRVVLVPFWLPPDMKEQLDTYKGNRTEWISMASPSYIVEKLGQTSRARSLTLLALLSSYTAIFTFLAVALCGAAVLLAGRWSRASPASLPAPPPCPSDEYDAFISHASVDVEVVGHVVRFVESKGLHCWIAPRDIPPGSEWAATIMQAIVPGRVFVLFYTEAAGGSPHIKRELAFAAERKLIIILVLLGSARAGGEIEYFAKTNQWMMMSLPPTKEEMTRLADWIRQLSGRGG
ncbi:MAG: toll/interleukin-1 receptor domain-containing protein [Planctomycetes bacterium]|nr:toll/interleukin-1 receptor domain-containing protein [Planctomycetota bacterium]